MPRREGTEPVLVERMRAFGTTIFAEMSALALTTGSINLGQGFPDVDGPEAMLRLAAEGLLNGLNQYPPGTGRPELREAVARHRARNFGLNYDPASEVLVTVGATEAVSATILALAGPGDEVIVFEPYYDSYAAAITLAGAQRVPVALRPTGANGRFTFDPDELRAAVTTRTKLVLVNTPHNPTGTVLTREELQVIADVCLDRDLLAVTDEVYEHLVYDEATHLPLATFPGMRERTVAISSAGKSFSVTGWKIGWIWAPAPLITAVNTVKQFLTYTHNGAMQVAVAYALDNEAAWVEALRLSLAAGRDRIAAGLETVGLTVSRPQGTYFIQADVRSLGLEDGNAFARALPRDAGVVAIPTAVFCDTPGVGTPFVRFAFCKRDDVLDEAVSRLTAYAERRST
jgi:N-succinyldiaminopimelate aminotransferase